jgi:hypothetical protein
MRFVPDFDLLPNRTLHPLGAGLKNRYREVHSMCMLFRGYTRKIHNCGATDMFSFFRLYAGILFHFGVVLEITTTKALTHRF